MSQRNKTTPTDPDQNVSESINSIISLIQSGEYAEADFELDALLPEQAHNPDINHLKGLVALRQDKLQEAEQWIRKAIFIKPDVASYHNNVGNIYKANGALKKAEACYRRAMELDPKSADAISNLGTIFLAAENSEYALTLFQQALSIQSGYVEAEVNMGSALLALERYQEVVDLCAGLSRRNVELPVVLLNWGRALKNSGLFFEAVDIFDRAVALYPEHADVHHIRGTLLRLIGDLEDGWKGYQWEPYSTESSRVIFDLSTERWQGQSLAGRKLLIYGEQGIGDEIMFASCFAELITLAEKTCIACEPRLEHLFRRSFPDATILSGCGFEQLKGYVKTYDIDVCCPMGDIPVYTRQKLSDFKQTAPYLRPEAALTTKWRQRYTEIGSGLKIGISWEGGKKSIQKRTRSIPLNQWIGLFDCADVQFVNAQYGDTAEQLKALEMETGVEIYDWPDTNGLTEMDDFAAKVAALDLVISIDNSTVHLAAAIGIETWVMLPTVPDWRWFLEREDSPWYASIKLFRQSDPGDWSPVLQQVVEQLQGKVRAAPLYQSKPRALFVNDTSNWYHWGCTATSAVIRRQLKEIGYEVTAISIKQIVNMQPRFEQLDDFQSDSFFEEFKQANSALFDALSDHDLIMINGEGSLHGLSATSLNLLYIAHIAKRWFGRNVQIINHSCYPLELTEWQNSVEFNLYKQVYQQLDYVAIREPISHRLMDVGGISNSLSFDCMPLYIEHYRDQIEKVDRAGVVLAGSVSWLQDSLAAITKLVKYLQSKSIEVTVLIGARDNIASDDVGFVNQLYAELSGNITVRVASTLQEWLQTLANTKLLVSGRFHHTIAAAMLDTAFVLLNSNTPKLEGIIELIGGDAPISYDDPDLFDKLCVAVDEKLQDELATTSAPLTEEQKLQLIDLAKVNFEAAEHYFRELTLISSSDTEEKIDEPVADPEGRLQRSLENTEHGLLLFDHDENVITQSLLEFGEYAVDLRKLFSQMLEKGSDIVEFGSGIGAVTVELARHTGEQGRVWAENGEPQEFLLLCANLALNEIGNVEFFDSVSDVDLPERCDMVLLNDIPWTTELENIVRNRFSSSRPFIMSLGATEGTDKLRQSAGYTFVEYSVDIARPDNFKGEAVELDRPQLQCLVGIPS